MTERPVVSAGQYGSNLNQLVFTVDTATGDVAGEDPGDRAARRSSPAYAADPATPGRSSTTPSPRPRCSVPGRWARSRPASTGPSSSTAAPRTAVASPPWATWSPRSSAGHRPGARQIAFMNPGGLRADMLGHAAPTTRATLTYKQAADVQPFANTLVTCPHRCADQEGARAAVAAHAAATSRRVRSCGSASPTGFTYTYDPARPEGDRITGMWLDGEPIASATTYSVTANSFLASGPVTTSARSPRAPKARQRQGRPAGDGRLHGRVRPRADPLAVDYAQRAVGVFRPWPATYAVGDTVTFNLSSLAMTGAGDLQDPKVEVAFDGQSVGEFAVDNTANAAGDGNSNDEAGKATVSFRGPRGRRGRHVRRGRHRGDHRHQHHRAGEVQAPPRSTTTVTATATPTTLAATTGTSTIEVSVTARADADRHGRGDRRGHGSSVAPSWSTARPTSSRPVRDGRREVDHDRYYGDAATRPARPRRR